MIEVNVAAMQLAAGAGLRDAPEGVKILAGVVGVVALVIMIAARSRH